MEKRKNIIGIDIGGTNFRLGVVSTDGCVRNIKIVPSDFVGNGGDPLETIACFIRKYIRECRLSRIDCISVGLPATVDKKREKVYSVPNILNEKGEHVLDNLNIVDGIGGKLGIPVVLNRDVNNLLTYDMFMYDLFGEEIVIGCYIGTGFGGAIYICGDYLLGKNGVANEIGHIPYYKGTEKCTCGKKACTECYASGRALKKLQQDHFPDTFIGDIFEKHRSHPLLRDFVEACALPVATEANIFDPDVVIIGGGVVGMPGFPKRALTERIKENVRHPLPAQTLKIMFSKENRNGGIIGAAIYAIKRRRVEVEEGFEERLKHSDA